MSRADELALAEGWFLADEERGLVIERDDDQGVFPDDVRAEAFVRARAAGGNELAAAALHAVRYNSRRRWDAFGVCPRNARVFWMDTAGGEPGDGAWFWRKQDARCVDVEDEEAVGPFGSAIEAGRSARAWVAASGGT